MHVFKVIKTVAIRRPGAISSRHVPICGVTFDVTCISIPHLQPAAEISIWDPLYNLN
jgi:hypothetical protein